MLVPFDVIVMPVEQVLLFYYAILGLAGLSGFFLLLYLALRYYRLGPLGKAELGNKHGSIGIPTDLNGAGTVKRLVPLFKGLMDTKDGTETYIIPEKTGIRIPNGPTIYPIEARGGAAITPETIKIAKALHGDKIPDINARDGKALILEFAQKFYYPNYLFQWPIR